MMDLNHTQKEIEKIKPLVEKLKSIVDKAENIIIIGNGGSNSIASHIAQDYTKVLGKKAISFSDPSRLTCYMNDYGIETGTHYRPIHSMTLFNKKNYLPNTELIGTEIVTIPTHPGLSQDDVNYIIKKINFINS